MVHCDDIDRNLLLIVGFIVNITNIDKCLSKLAWEWISFSNYQ
jgi:phosphotransferase system IIB component